MYRLGAVAMALLWMAPLVLSPVCAQAEPTPEPTAEPTPEPTAEPAPETPACDPPVIHRHATMLPANAPGFLIDEGSGGSVTSVHVSRLDTRETIPVTLIDDFVRFDGPIEPRTHLTVEIHDGCAAAEAPVNYSLDVGEEVPVPTSLGALMVGEQVEGLLPLGGVAGSKVDAYGWEPVGVFRETVLHVPPNVLPYDALLDVTFVYDGREGAPTPPETGLVGDRYKSVVHARCDRGSDTPGIGEGSHRIEAIGVFTGMDLSLRVGPAKVALECTPKARAAVEGHRQAIALRPWYELGRWLRSIRQDAFAIIVLVSFGWALIRWKRKRARNWPFSAD
jgi:hypothetical protein